jgi:hypothetical protein
MNKLGLMETLFAMGRIDFENRAIGDASRIVGMLASFQDRFVGAVSLCDLMNARDTVECILEGITQVRPGDKSWKARRFLKGIRAGVEIGWLEKRGDLVVVKPCWYDDRSVAEHTRRRVVPDGPMFGSKVIQEGLYATV